MLKFSTRIIKGFYIILKGEVKVENHTNWNGFILQSGDFFGYTLLFKEKSVTDFGRIVALSD